MLVLGAARKSLGATFELFFKARVQFAANACVHIQMRNDHEKAIHESRNCMITTLWVLSICS